MATKWAGWDEDMRGRNGTGPGVVEAKCMRTRYGNARFPHVVEMSSPAAA